MDASDIRGLLFALTSGLVGGFFAQSYKIRTNLKFHPVSVVVGFAIWHCLLSSLLTTILRAWHYSLPLFVCGITYGISFTMAIYLYMQVSEKVRLNISWTIIQMSVVLPFGLSILLFGERPNSISWMGIFLILVSICLFSVAKSKNGNKTQVGEFKTLLMLIFASLFTGFNLFVPKILNHVDPGNSIFSLLPLAGISMLPTALLLVVASPAYRVTNISSITRKFSGCIFLSCYMAIMASVATVLVYYAITHLSGSIVYPVRNVVCVVTVSLLAALLFQERTTKLEVFGIGISLCGIALISAAL